MSTIRKNINVSIKLDEWYRKEAKEMGVSQSALMAMAMSKYIEDKENMIAIATMIEMEKQKEIEESN